MTLLMRRTGRRRVSAGGTETFTGANGSAWPSPWVTTSLTADLSSGAGRLVTDSTAFSQGFARRNGPNDGELTIRWQWSVAGSDRSFTTVVRGGTTFGDNPKFEIRANPAEMWLRRSGTLLSQDTGVTFAVGTWYWFRIRWNGALIQARAWADGAAEPSTWNVSATDNTGPTSGNILVRVENGNDASADTVLVDDFTLATISGGTSTGFGSAPFGSTPFGS